MPKPRNRYLALGASVATTAVLAALVVSRPSPRTSPSTAADGCASISLQDTLAVAKSAGALVIVADSTLTGNTVQDGPIYNEMTLHNVETISGPIIASDINVWVSGARGPWGPIPGADAGAL